MRDQHKPEEFAPSPKEISVAKENAANSSRQKQANANQSKREQSDNSKNKNRS